MSRRGRLVALAVGGVAIACLVAWWFLARPGAPVRAVRVEGFQPMAVTGALAGGAPLEGTRRRLLEDAPLPAGGGAVERVAVSVDGQRRNAVVGRVPFGFAYQVTVPPAARLRFGLNRDAAPAPAGELRFSLRVRDEDGMHPVFERRLGAAASGWVDEAADLGEFAGREVSLFFSVASTDEETTAPAAFWADLLLSSETPAPERPNVFVILVDTLRPDHLGVYGYGRDTSPTIDGLAARGVTFTGAVSTAPWTDPSILSLFTGLYPSDAWVGGSQAEIQTQGLPPSVDTMAEVFAAAGYQTVALSDHPAINGDRFSAGFDVYVDLPDVNGPTEGWRETPADQILEQVRTVMTGRPATGLFTYFHVLYPHWPYEAPPPYDEMFGPKTDRMEVEHRERVLNMYDAEIRRVDALVGAYLAALERLGLADDAVIALLSDHGEGFWEHDLWEHGNSLYNELLRVPLILAAPGRLPAGVTVPDVVRPVDLFPTLLDLAGVEYAGTHRGVSLVPRIGRPGQSGLLAFSEFPIWLIVEGAALQSAEAKLIAPGGGASLEYYDLVRDPREEAPLAAPARTAAARRLESLLGGVREEAAERRATVPAAVVTPSPETLERLRALGYIR